MLCQKCLKRPTCKKPCKKLIKELNKVTHWKDNREVTLDASLIDNHLIDQKRGHFGWNNSKYIKRKRPKDNPRFVRNTYIDKLYARLFNKYNKEIKI